MNDKELLHHLECLQYKIKNNIPMVEAECRFMSNILLDIINKMKEKEQ